MSHKKTSAVTGVILAGGLSRRMGGVDKCTMPLGGKIMLAHSLDCLAAQVETLIINCNGDLERFEPLGQPIVEDLIEGHAGPLAGILTGMRWSQKNTPKAKWIVTVAADTPFLPNSLVAQLMAATKDNHSTIVLAQSGDRLHPVVGLWPVELADALQDFLTNEQSRKVLVFVDRYKMKRVSFHPRKMGGQQVDPFFNVNTNEELKIAETVLAEMNQ
jgi:molybdopterin-guanine dinucleotide biosynthesis protein A